MCYALHMVNKDTFKRLFYKIQDFFPTSLPVGLTQFNDWCDRLLFTYFPPGASAPTQESFRFSVAAMVLHLDSQSNKITNRFFGKAIQKGAANEVASYVMQFLKEQRDAAIRAQNEVIRLEATAPTVVPNEPQK